MSESLFEKLGGKDAVDAAVDLFYQRVLDDSSISHFFEPERMNQLRAKLGENAVNPTWIFNMRGVGYRMATPDGS